MRIVFLDPFTHRLDRSRWEVATHHPATPLARRLLGYTLACAAAIALCLPAQGHARFEKHADLDAVSVSTDAAFQVNEGKALRTWILLDFKDSQSFAPGSSSLAPTAAIAYRSRKDYVQVDCQRNMYAELATQMFSETEGKGQTLFESTYHRSPMPRFATPSSHEGVVLQFLCKGVKPN